MRNIGKIGILSCVLGLVLCMSVASVPHVASAGWEPKKSVEFIIMAGKGAAALLAERGVDPNDGFVALAPGASYGSSKLWPAKSFACVTEDGSELLF